LLLAWLCGKLNGRLVELNVEAQEDVVARRVLRQMYPEHKSAALEPAAASCAAGRIRILGFDPANASRIISSTVPEAKQAIKDIVLSIVRQEAGKYGMTASTIRARVKLRHGIDVNPNTLTVSLVRHRKAGQLECRGRRWFYAAAKDQQAMPFTNGHSETREAIK
jgi:hypothetical protein